MPPMAPSPYIKVEFPCTAEVHVTILKARPSDTVQYQAALCLVRQSLDRVASTESSIMAVLNLQHVSFVSPEEIRIVSDFLTHDIQSRCQDSIGGAHIIVASPVVRAVLESIYMHAGVSTPVHYYSNVDEFEARLVDAH